MLLLFVGLMLASTGFSQPTPTPGPTTYTTTPKGASLVTLSQAPGFTITITKQGEQPVVHPVNGSFSMPLDPSATYTFSAMLDTAPVELKAGASGNPMCHVWTGTPTGTTKVITIVILDNPDTL
jgi:hypothetical protein